MEDRELLERIARAVGVTPGVSVVTQITLGQLFMAYKKSRPRGRYWQQTRNLLRPFVVKFWRRPAASLSLADWEEHRRARRKEKTRLGSPPRELTLNLELLRTKQMFKFAVEEDKLTRSPLRKAKYVKTRERRESWFTAEQIQQLIDASTCLRWRHQQLAFAALVTVMGDTGLRISEALSLRWDRITLKGVTSVLGKGAKTRVVAFTPRAMEALATLDRHPNTPKVFVNYTTWKPFDASTVRRWFKKAIKFAGLEGVKADGDLALVPHILRHSAASIADERGAPATWIQAMLGHSSLDTTRVYLHRSTQDAALRMAAIMSGRKGPRKSPKLMPTSGMSTSVGKNTSRKSLIS